jgi:capsid protein
LFRALVNKPSRHAVGRGITPSAATKDLEWNKLADAWFRRVSKTKTWDVSRQRNFRKIQLAIAQHMMRDGECFVLLINDGKRQRYQLVESAKVGYNRSGSIINNPDIVDGVKYDDYGAPLKYYFKEPGNSVREIDADNVLHIFDSERAGLGRGLPWVYHGVNQGMDILDLVGLEKRASKVHAAFAAAVKSKSGAFGDSNIDLGVSGGQRKKDPNIDKIFGGQVVHLEPDEELDLLRSDRPNTELIPFLEFLGRDATVGAGLSPEFVWDVSKMGGANTRYILADVEILLDAIQYILIEEFCIQFRRLALAGAMDRGELPICKDPNFDNATWQTPPSLTVDRGRDGKLYIEMVKNGMMTLDQYWSMQGHESRAMREQCIREIAEDRAMCKALGVPYECYRPPTMRLDPVQAEEERDSEGTPRGKKLDPEEEESAESDGDDVDN